MPTLTEAPAGTRTSISVESAGGGRVRVMTSVAGGPQRPTIRPVIVTSDSNGAVVSLVPEGALLLDGDAVSIDVAVEAGLRLKVIEPAGTVAYDMRGGAACWSMRAEVGAGALLDWQGEAFVAAAGSRTTWSARVTLADDGQLRLRETLVLGRTGEQPGRLDHNLEVLRADGTPLLVDSLALGPDQSPLLLGGGRVIHSTLLIRVDDEGAPGVRFALEGGGKLVRSIAQELHELDVPQIARAI